jgi:biopolymer transport protein ExbD
MYNGKVDDRATLFTLLSDKTKEAVAEGKLPPQVHLKADRRARYEQVARVLYTIQTSGIVEVSFLTEPKGAAE